MIYKSFRNGRKANKFRNENIVEIAVYGKDDEVQDTRKRMKIERYYTNEKEFETISK